VEIARKTKEEQKRPGVRLNTKWNRIAWVIFASGTNNLPSRVEKIQSEWKWQSLKPERRCFGAGILQQFTRLSSEIFAAYLLFPHKVATSRRGPP
jgi:sulfite reductase beta subunit-like hemoprotein